MGPSCQPAAAPSEFFTFQDWHLWVAVGKGPGACLPAAHGLVPTMSRPSLLQLRWQPAAFQGWGWCPAPSRPFLSLRT